MTFEKKSTFASFEFDSKDFYGELTAENASSRLRFTSISFIPPVVTGDWLLGITQDRKRLTCIDCLDMGMGSTWNASNESFFTRTIFPHFTAIGSAHLRKDEKSVSQISFRITDGDAYFYDFSSFGLISDPVAFATIQHETEKNYAIKSGDNPILLYFDGRYKLIECTTDFGDISVVRHVNVIPSGKKGNRVDSEIHVHISSKISTDFTDALKKVLALRSFFTMIIGRHQGISDVELAIKNPVCEELFLLKVQPSHASDWDVDKELFSVDLNNHDASINPTSCPDEFKRVLKEWILKEELWKVARFRFESCIKKHQYYDIDRLVSAANMFDILPSSAYPKNFEVTAEMQEAILKSVAILKLLPPDSSRDSALGAIKRMRKLSLPKKVKHRAGIVITALGHTYEGLERISKIAIKARNFFVHGSEDFNHSAYENQISFLTDTLEFIFSASDMIENGWDASAWHERSHGTSNLYSRYKFIYQESLLAFDKIEKISCTKSTRKV